MRPLHKIIAGGVAAIALVGVAGWAAAEINNTHVLDVRLPDGGVAHIRYVGDTPPTVNFASAPTPLSIFAPASEVFGPASPFAAMERISEVMDRQADALLRDGNVSGLTSGGPGLTQVDLGKLPPGAQGFSMVSTLTGGGVCTRSVQYRSPGDGKPPQIETRTSGACATDPKTAAPTATSTAATAQLGHPSGRPI